MLNELMTHFLNGTGSSTFPYMDLVSGKDGTYSVILAVAGFNKDNLSVWVEDNHLFVKGEKCGSSLLDILPEKSEFVHQGISKRPFERRFILSKDVEVESSDLIDGLLVIHLREIEEKKNIKKIPISSSHVGGSVKQDGLNHPY